ERRSPTWQVFKKAPRNAPDRRSALRGAGRVGGSVKKCARSRETGTCQPCPCGYCESIHPVLKSMRHSLKSIFPQTLLLLSALFGLVGPGAFAQTTTADPAWTYLLLHDSYLLDDCQVCDRISAPVPMRGRFNLRVLE